MKIDLSGFHAFITGGSSGFGFEMAKTLLSHGATVAIAARGGDKLDKSYETLKKEGFDIYARAMDVRDEESVAEAAKWYGENFDKLDMLINNAGIGNLGINKGTTENPSPFYEIDTSAFYNIVNTNFIGYFLVARAFVPLILKNGKGRVVNVSTSIRTMTAPGQLPYGPARAAAEAMSTIIGDELKDKGITVNILLPGGASNTGFVPEDKRAEFESRGLLPASILNEPILFLASERAEGMTGERIIAKDFKQWLEEKHIEDWIMED